MCGIFGAVHVPACDPLDARAALATLGHRGPDASGLFRDEGVTLGHTRLAIIDLTPAGAQPMQDATGRVTVTFNGEIYNHHDLRRELRARGTDFRSRSDTEVIVEGYRAWGERVVDKLDGMFAFGLWDADRRRLLLGRDRCGKKPLFYSFAPGRGLRFASEVKALVASGLPAAIDESSLPTLLAFGYPPADRSMYRGVRQLPPATLLVLDEGGEPVLRRYWEPPFSQPKLEVTEVEARREVRRLAQQAVLRRLEADVPLGAFLSGGVDSTVVVGVMAHVLGRHVKTFSIGFEGDPRFDETHYARIAATTFGTDHTEFRLQPSSFDLVERLVALHDGPFGDSSAIPTSVVSMLTRRHVTVALTGDGGDELFCGYLRFLASEATEHVPMPVRRAGARVARFIPPLGGERSTLARARRLLQAAVLPLPDRLARLVSLFCFELPELVRPEARAVLDLDEPLGATRALVERTRGSTLSRTLEHNFRTYLPNDLLVKADRCSMLHGLEVRSPLLDTELIDYAARLPDAMLRRGLTTKRILRQAFADLIPPAIMRRGKMGFGVPLGAWFRGQLNEYLRDRLSPGARLYDYLDRRFVERLIREHTAGRVDHGHRLWLLLTLEVWLRSLSRVAAAPAPVNALA